VRRFRGVQFALHHGIDQVLQAIRREATEPALQQQLIGNLQDALADNRLAWDLHSDGRYVLRWPGRDEQVRNFHETLMRQATERAKIL